MLGLIRNLFLSLLIAAMAGRAIAQPASPIKPASRPATGPSDETSAKVRQLARKALELATAGKIDAAEATLLEALTLNPLHSTNLYNMACIKALRGRPEAAMDYLERAAAAGFTDFIHIEKDSDLASLRELPRYKDFIASKEKYQRKAADLVLSYLKREFGEGYIYDIDEKNKLIFATNTDVQTLAAVKKWLVAQADSQFNTLFSHRPDQYISVILPSAADYKQIVMQPGVGGFYNHDNRILICQRLGQVMTHEFTHALHNADLDVLGQEHPVWVSEGLAVMYEAAAFEGERLVPADNFRLPFIQRAARANRLIPLATLVAMEQKAFVKQATNAYGQSGSLMLWLHEKELLKTFYEAMKDTFEKDKTGKLALEQTTGKTLAEVEKEWKQWMLRRKPPVMNTGENGPVIGVTFAEANDGLRIRTIAPNGPAAKAGLRVGDAVVSVDSSDVYDQQSLIPLLAAREPGDRVMLRIRRGQRYIDVGVTLGARSETARQP